MKRDIGLIRELMEPVGRVSREEKVKHEGMAETRTPGDRRDRAQDYWHQHAVWRGAMDRSWPSDAAIVRRFMVFLEDRRVLYNPMDLEVVSQVETSVHAIREECTKTLQALPPDVFAATPLRLIRAAARRFQDDQHEEFRFFDERRHARGATPGFFTALGAFRATVGQQVALLVAYYDIDIEGDLATVLPELEENGS